MSGKLEAKTRYVSLSNTAISISIFIGSILMLWLCTGLNSNIFNTDDNQNQWLPIIDTTYKTLLTHGYFPAIDFFQMKGLLTVDVGYNSVLNPIVFVSYLFNNYVLASTSNTISVYIFISYALGNSLMYLLLRKIGSPNLLSMLGVFIYCSVSAYIYYAYWFNVMHNYFMIPMLLLCILVSENTRVLYITSGVVLAFSLYMGHVQYTLYLYILYGIIMICLTLINKSLKHMLSLLTNVLVAGILSFPQLLLMVQASSRRSIIVNNEFLSFPLDGVSQLIFSVIPAGILDIIIHGNEAFLPEFTRVMTYNKYALVYSGIALPLFICAIYEIVFKRNKRYCEISYENDVKKYVKILFSTGYIGLIVITFISKTYLSVVLLVIIWFILLSLLKRYAKTKYLSEYSVIVSQNSYNTDLSIVIACLVSCTFFILFSWGSDGIIAYVMSIIPLINSFRILFKGIFIFTPLIVIIAIYYVDRYIASRHKKSIIALVIGFCLIGIVQNYLILNSGYHRFYNDRYSIDNMKSLITDRENELLSLSIDKNNFRMMAMIEPSKKLQSENISYKNIFYNSKWDNKLGEAYDIKKYLNRNFGTMLGVFTLGAYDNSVIINSYKQSELLFSNEVVEFSGMNGADLSRIIVFNDKADNRVEFYNQIKLNSVKYFIFSKNSQYIAKFAEIIDKIPQTKVIRIIDFLNDSVVMEIDGVDSLCKDQLGNTINMIPEMGRLHFNKNINDEIQTVTLSFTFNDHYKAVFTDVNGNEMSLSIMADDMNYTTIDCKDLASGTVTLSYNNVLVNFALIMDIVTLILMITITIYFIYQSYVNKATVNSTAYKVTKREYNN